MKDEEPILVIGQSTSQTLFGLLTLVAAALVLSFGPQGWAIVIALMMAVVGLKVISSAGIGFPYSEIQFYDGHLFLKGLGIAETHSYDDVESFHELCNHQGRKLGWLVVTLASGRRVSLPPEHYYDVMEIIQSRVKRDIPGFERLFTAIGPL